jgi:hypothetical protein
MTVYCTSFFCDGIEFKFKLIISDDIIANEFMVHSECRCVSRVASVIVSHRD